MLLVFNRPDVTRRMLDALRPARPTRIFVVADGPRASVPGDAAACAEVRALIGRAIDWPADVQRDFADENLGLRRRVASGLDWAFRHVEEAIVLEDDCVPSPSFFPFCAELLARFRDEPRVGVITGDNFQQQPFACDASYYFSKYPHCWGWATWRRAWSLFDDSMAQWPELRDRGWLGELFSEPVHAAYWRNIFDLTHRRKISSWAYVWTFVCWSRGFVTATPARNLVVNIGFGSDGTHTKSETLAGVDGSLADVDFPLRHPADIEINSAADRYVQNAVFSPPPIAPKPRRNKHFSPRGNIMLSFLQRLLDLTGRPAAAADLLTPRGFGWARRRLERVADPELFAQLNSLKAGRVAQRGIDLLRALYFLRQRQTGAATEALKEELRFFPDNSDATALLQTVEAAGAELPDDAEFRELFAAVRPYTMLSVPRLWSLFRLAREVCVEDLPGNFVECGVAAGGSSAMLAAVIARHSRRPRTLFSCDTFEGMPAAEAADTHRGQQADAIGWGTGTCAAPVDSLREILRKLGVEKIVEPLPGLFGETLPANRARIGGIAFLHMDGDWHSSTRDIFDNLFDQVATGARIQIDDYGFWDGCRRAVEEFSQERGLKFNLHVIDETGVWLTK